jgi:hypothetical protein
MSQFVQRSALRQILSETNAILRIYKYFPPSPPIMTFTSNLALVPAYPIRGCAFLATPQPRLLR